VKQAEELHRAAMVLESLADHIQPAQHVSVSIDDRDSHTIDIHGTQPVVLEAIEAIHPTEHVQRDADGIVRYVSVKLGEIEVTWHRR
jgi:hypothetical protein